MKMIASRTQKENCLARTLAVSQSVSSWSASSISVCGPNMPRSNTSADSHANSEFTLKGLTVKPRKIKLHRLLYIMPYRTKSLKSMSLLVLEVGAPL
jgi:hypothetical protein